jgi:hypothetical protein
MDTYISRISFTVAVGRSTSPHFSTSALFVRRRFLAGYDCLAEVEFVRFFFFFDTPGPFTFAFVDQSVAVINTTSIHFPCVVLAVLVPDVVH